MLFQIVIYNKTWPSSSLYIQLRRIQTHVRRLRWTFFEKNVNSFQILTSFAKGSILDVWQESEYVSAQWTIKDKQTTYRKDEPQYNLNEEKGCWSHINQGITTNFEHSGEVGWAEAF